VPLALLTALILAAAPPPSPETASVVAGLQAWLDGTTTLEARFRQSLVSGALGTTASESGRFYLERPGRMRWDYENPERKIALLIGDRTSLYLEADRQLVRGRLHAEDSALPGLLAGDGRLLDLFTATLAATPSAGGRGRYRLRLAPRGERDAFAEVTLTLRPKVWAVEEAEVLDEMGNRTTYVFTEAKRNRPLPVGVFAFEPPAGTEIVDER